MAKERLLQLFEEAEPIHEYTGGPMHQMHGVGPRRGCYSCLDEFGVVNASIAALCAFGACGKRPDLGGSLS